MLFALITVAVQEHGAKHFDRFEQARYIFICIQAQFMCKAKKFNLFIQNTFLRI